MRNRRDQKVVGLKDALLRSSGSANMKSVEEQESDLRSRTARNPVFLMISGNVAALKIFLYYLVTIETMVVLVLTIGLTMYWYLTYVSSFILVVVWLFLSH